MTSTRLPERVSAIVDIWRRLAAAGWQAETAKQLFQRVSDLSTAALDGNATQINESALSAEVYLSSFVDSNLTPSAHQIAELGHLLESLVAAAEKRAEPSGIYTSRPAPSRPAGSSDTGVVYYLGADVGLLRPLAVQLETEGLHLETIDTASGLLSKLEHSTPSAIVVDTSALESECTSLGELSEAVHRSLRSPPPCLVIGPSQDLGVRLEAMRAGADAFFVAPVTAEQVLSRIQLIRERNQPEEFRVLVVEDDPAQADFAVKILSKAHMQAVAVTEPLQVMKRLEEFRPDLVLMDLYMPEASGTELTAIIREHDEYSSIPIVFLSGELDKEKQFNALTLGGDDFLPKPIRPKRLIETVRHRIQRTRAMQSRLGMLSSHDPVSKLFSRRHFIEILDQALRNRTALPPATAVLLLEIDEPERIHAQVGIGGTDEVLAELGSLITSVKQSDDVAARFGDHRFCVLARREQRSQIETLTTLLSEVISNHLFEVAGAALKMTASIGIAFHGFDIAESSSLIARSEKACAEAHRRGGAGTVVFVPHASEVDEDRKLKFMLLDAVAKGSFKVLFQPVVSLRGLKGNRYQLQIKLEDEDGSQIGEDRFRSLASDEGLDGAIDEFILDKTLAILEEQSRQGNRLILLLRLSGAALASDAWAVALAQHLAERRLTARSLILEFGFEDVNRQLSSAIRVLTSLRRLGFTTGLADFGSSPLCFSLIEELPTIYLRLAPATLRLNPAQLTEFIDRIHKKNRVAVVSGVSDAKSVHSLWACGADYLQGDFVQRPLGTPNFDNSEFFTV